MAEQVDQHTYSLGVRNPRTTESPDIERQRAAYWRHVMAWVLKPGGKYIA